MCGIAGFWEIAAAVAELQEAKIQQMVTAIAHRGPDDAGVWVDATCGLALGNRRLAIVDLSPAGHQPMFAASGRYVIVYNGEVYNFQEIGQKLAAEGVGLCSHSDTEVIIEACVRWGVEATLPLMNGMFAFALWDKKTRTLTLVRDRLGVKPLYYGWCGNHFVFASELKAIAAYPHFKPEVDRDSLTLFLRHNYIPAPFSIYRNIYKLLPGHLLRLTQPSHHATPVAYWSAYDVAQEGVERPFAGSEQEAILALDGLLRDAVRLRMISDVPLGVFLSGGIDSSTVAALMQAQSSRPVRTFTIGFSETAYNEAGYAEAVANHLGTEHTALCVTPSEAQAVIPQLAQIYDEPFSDSSQIPTWLVSKLARQHVTVALSGDGGDELFAGYHRYFWGQRVWHYLRLLPPQLRRLCVAAIYTLSPERWEKMLRLPMLNFLSRRISQPGDKLHKLARLLRSGSPREMYHFLVSHEDAPAQLVIAGTEPATLLATHDWQKWPDFLMAMMYLDLVSYLPDDILAKVDRASMAVSLESREPLLDYRLVAWAWRLPLHLKVRHGQGKWLLRQVLYRYVPAHLLERPKMGFAIPLGDWLRGPLRDWAEHLLDEKRLQTEGFLSPAAIRDKWAEHLSGRRNWQYWLWNVLMFEAWQQHWHGC
jgi:asparagine synthase (glutamine-hydrolysing)